MALRNDRIDRIWDNCYKTAAAVLANLSRLEWAERMCGHDHDKKTQLGWSLVAGTGKRAFVAPDDPRHPKNAGRAPPGEERAA